MELAAAEEAAKKASLKIWEHYSEQQEAEARAAAAATAAAEEEPIPDAQKQVIELEVVEICDGCHFFCHVAGNKEVTALQQQLAASGLKDAEAHKFQPGHGALCMAKFSEDGQVRPDPPRHAGRLLPARRHQPRRASQPSAFRACRSGTAPRSSSASRARSRSSSSTTATRTSRPTTSSGRSTRR